MTDFRSIAWASDAENIAARFEDYRRVMRHWESVLPATIHHVDYEQTTADLEGTARRLVDACGLEWENGCLEFYRNRRPVRTASLTQVRRPIYFGSVNRWKNYQDLLPEALPWIAGMLHAVCGPAQIAGAQTAHMRSRERWTQFPASPPNLPAERESFAPLDDRPLSMSQFAMLLCQAMTAR